MATIDRLTALDELVAADNLVVYSSANGDARRASLTTLLTFLQDSLDGGDLVAPSSSFDTQYSAPAAGNTVQVASMGAPLQENCTAPL